VTDWTAPTAWIEAARAGFVDAWRLMADVVPGGATSACDGLALAATGLNISGCNTAMALRLPDDPQVALEHAVRFFGARNLPWVLYAGDATAVALGPHALAAGLRRSYPEPAMFLLPEDVQSGPDIPGLAIEVVRDSRSMDVYRATAARGFGGTEDGFAIWANAHLLGTPGLRFFLGLMDGEPVATSCVYALHGIATINMVSTVKSHRRQGIGEAMTWRAIHDGLDDGCAVAFLHASEMGHPVYQRMGFRHAFTYNIWTASNLPR
jgi:GNAT superfamily N-acetyltransferase